jgi:16S rRNA processing protein RimM
MPSPDWETLIVVARIARPHGLRGEVILDAETDFPDERFQPGATVLMRAAEGVTALTVTSLKFHKGRPIVAFDGIDIIEDAEPLVGRELRIAVSDLKSLPPGVFYHHDLVGCRVETVEGDEVGTVTRVDGGGGTSRLTVGGPAGEQLIPLVDAICRTIDTTTKRIVIDAPEGLLGLNQTNGPRRVRRGWRT